MRPSWLASAGVLVTLVACSDTQEFRTATTPDFAPALPSPSGAGATLPPVSKPTAAPAVVLASDQALNESDPGRQGPQSLAADDTWVYWIDIFSHLARVPKAGGDVESLADTFGTPFALALVGDYLYFTNIKTNRIERLAKDGKGSMAPVTVASAGDWNEVRRFVIDGPRITWIDGTRLFRCASMPCSASTEIPLSNQRPMGLATVGEHIFVPYLVEDPNQSGTYLPGGGIYAAEASESGQVPVPPLMYGPLVAEREANEPSEANAATVYAAAEHMIVRATTHSGAAAQVLASGEDADSYPYALQLGGSYLYWVNRGAGCTGCAGGSIMRVKKDGAARPEKVFAARGIVNSFLLTTDAIYLTTGRGQVLKIPRPAEGALN